MPLPPLVVLAAYALIAFEQAYAVLTNLTIDDTDNAYWTFVGSYNVVTASTPCPGCVAQPDPAQVFNRSWHDGGLRSGSFTFQGSAVYIYGIDITNPANLTFTISNPSLTSFHFYSGDGYVYKSLFFWATNLDAGVQHTVSWLMETSTFGGQSALFDYAIVTVDLADISSSASRSAGSISSSVPSVSPSATVFSSASSSAGSISSSASFASPSGISPIRSNVKTVAIVGATVGTVVGLALLAALLIFLRRRRSITADAMDGTLYFYDLNGTSRSTSRPTEYTIEPFGRLVPPPPPLIPIKGSDSRSLPAVSIAGVSSAPVSTLSTSRTTSSSVPPAACDPNDPSYQRFRDLELQERLRHLEEIVAASQPPVYS